MKRTFIRVAGRAQATTAVLVAAGLVYAGVAAAIAPQQRVGRQADGSVVTSTNQVLRPSGRQVEFPGRPSTIATNPRGGTAAALSGIGEPLAVINLATGRVLQRTGSALGAASYAGLAYSPDGRRLYASFTDGFVTRFTVADDGTLSQPVRLVLPLINGGSDTDAPTGLAVSRDGRRLYVALNLSNRLAVLDANTGAELARFLVGVAPQDVVLTGNTVLVGNRGGRRARPGDRTNLSAGTPVVSTASTGGAATGTVSVVDLLSRSVTNVGVGLHPSGIAVRGRYAFVANANSDTVSVLDVPLRRSVSTIAVRPFPGSPYGSSPNAVAPFGGDRFAVTLGRNNALGVYRWRSPAEPAVFEGVLPTGWYPADVVVDTARAQLLVANDLGVGAVAPAGTASTGAVKATQTRGSVSLVSFPTRAALDKGTRTVFANNGWSWEAPLPKRTGVAPVPVPERLGEPSLIKHVFYVIKENRTYDQILGDDPRGNGDPTYVQFPESVTPNQHSLAQRFPLFDNFYVNGSVSADAHLWATQAYVTDYVERSFGGWARSYPYDGGDALAYAPSGFLWENAEKHGRSVRVYGEFADHTDATGTRSDIPSLDRVLVRDFPKFDLNVRDTTRAKILIDDLNEQVKAGTVADLTIVQLPLDHTHGLAPGKPTPNFDVADNDVALGRFIEALSKSPIWHESAVFVYEDDAQFGLDHVDGHRTTAFVASPYAPAGLVDSTYYTQINLIRTIEQILGLPPMNQMDLAAQPMTTAFSSTPDLRPFTALPNTVPYAVNPPLKTLSGVELEWAEASADMDFSIPDAPNEQLLNRAIWYGIADGEPYPGDGRVLSPDEVLERYGNGDDD